MEDKKECEIPCGLNHCDINGCSNRERHAVPPDEVVKDLDYFLNELAKKEGFESIDDVDSDKIGYIGAMAESLWYKHQLEEQHKQYSILMELYDQYVTETVRLETITEQQKKEIDEVWKKGYFQKDQELIDLCNQVHKLTHENEALKQK